MLSGHKTHKSNLFYPENQVYVLPIRSKTAQAGYPDGKPPRTMWHGTGTVCAITTDRFVTNCYSTGGIGGLPVYDEAGQVVGIATGYGPNHRTIALRLRQSMIDFLGTW